MDQLRPLIAGFTTTAVLHAAVTSGIVDALDGDDASAVQIADRAGVLPDPAMRVLRALVVYGLVSVDDQERFSPLAPLQALRPGGELRNMVEWWGHNSYRAWGELSTTLRSGQSGQEIVFGQGLWQQFADHPEQATTFNGMMRDFSRAVQEALPGPLGLTDELVVDVGGGLGHLVGALLLDAPRARGVVFDQPSLQDDAEALITRLGLEGRSTFEGGDFFERVPAGDVLVLKWILHDWNDEACRRLLTACRAAISEFGRIVIVERVLPELGRLPVAGPAALESITGDLMMLAMFGADSARERTEAEYAALLDATGFALDEVVALGGAFSALIALPR